MLTILCTTPYVLQDYFLCHCLILKEDKDISWMLAACVKVTEREKERERGEGESVINKK